MSSWSLPNRRITPACAGKRPCAPSWCLTVWDHPRVCGEKRPPTIWTRPAGGSPPRVRGKDPLPVRHRLQPGITPACAGKRGEGRAISCAFWDHPRVCGEKRPSMNYVKHSQGSPPRVRGKAGFRLIFANGFGITPACAGKRFL